MKIAIDLTAVPKSKAGVGIYLVNLIENLQKLDDRNQYYLIIQDDDLGSFKLEKSNFEYIPVKSKYLRNVPFRLIWEQLILPFKLKKLKVDLLHSPHYTMPYMKFAKNVVTFHDMNFFIIPEMHTFAKRKLVNLYIWLTLRMANGIIAVSKVVAEDTKRIFKVKNKDIFVAELGVDKPFFEDSDADEEILKSYGINGEYFLYVGTIEPRKNLVRVFTAYNNLPEEIKNRYKFVVCGSKGWMYDDVFKYVENNGLKDRVIFTGPVSHTHLPSVYKGAKLFIYASLYEGFGIPVLEAMASGIPCITSNISNMNEVAGDACYKINPYEEKQIRDAIIELLENDKLYNELKIRGIKRAQSYTWSECARKTLEAYKSLLRGNLLK